MDEAQDEQFRQTQSMAQDAGGSQFRQFGNQIAQFQQSGGQGDEDSGLPGLNILFFGAGCTLMFGSFLGMLTMLFSFSFADCLGLVYCFSFGSIVAILDAPVQHGANPTLVMADNTIGKYLTFVTSTTGKGICLLATACTLACIMFSNFDSTLIKFMEFCMMSGVVFVGFLGASIGYKKSNDLNHVREAILTSCPGGVSQIESAMCPFALTFPGENGTGHSLTMDEFNKFITEIAQCDEWGHDDLKLAFKGMRQRRPGMHKTIMCVDMHDIEGWLEGRRVYL